jgi:hypothetical protein
MSGHGHAPSEEYESGPCKGATSTKPVLTPEGFDGGKQLKEATFGIKNCK